MRASKADVVGADGEAEAGSVADATCVQPSLHEMVAVGASTAMKDIMKAR